MNKKELIDKIESLPSLTSITSIRPYVDKKIVLGLISQLDEPQKVKVSEEEAKFLETFDFNCESDVTTALYHVSRVGYGYYLKDNNDIELKDLSEGFRELENRKRLIKAILDGYEVEKEKRYLVKMNGVNDYGCYLNKGLLSKEYFWESKAEIGGCRTKHTRKQLENDDFGWVFDCPGIEIEEVEG
jgi:hypothetical protein|nr:MAG TPA: Protein of unknown function (DUF1642) [Caudoviricetes sp.]